MMMMHAAPVLHNRNRFIRTDAMSECIEKKYMFFSIHSDAM